MRPSIHLCLLLEQLSLLLGEDTDRVFEAEDFQQADVHLTERLLLELLDIALQNQILMLDFPLVFLWLTSIICRRDILRRLQFHEHTLVFV